MNPWIYARITFFSISCLIGSGFGAKYGFAAEKKFPLLLPYKILKPTGKSSAELDSMLRETLAGSAKDCIDILSWVPQNIQVRVLQVPENWQFPEQKPKIHVTYYYVPASAEAESPPTVIFFNGGPGSSSLSSMQWLLRSEEAKQINWVFLDQRGTGCSSAYPADGKEMLAKAPLYGTRAIAYDAEAVRRSFAGPKRIWHVFGHSFGGNIAIHYLKLFSDSIASFHLHGLSLSDDPVAWIETRLLGQERVLESYFSLYPEDRQKLLDIKTSIKEDQCFGDGSLNICGPQIIDALFIRVGFPMEWKQMHQEITMLASLGPFFLDLAIQSQFFPKISERVSLPTLLIGQMLAGTDLRSACSNAYSQREILRAPAKEILLSDCNLLLATSTIWDKAFQDFSEYDLITLSGLKENIEEILAERELPIQIYSSEYDSFSPRESFSFLTEHLPDGVNYVHFGISGHEGYYREKKILQTILTIHQGI